MRAGRTARMATDDGDLAARCRREVRELHDFFGEWYRGDVPERKGVARLDRALGPEFTMVGPDGERHDRAAVVAGVRSGHGERAGVGAERRARASDADDAFEIAITSLSVADETADRCLLTYEERHRGSAETARASAAWFEPDADAPLGVRWTFLQETWLPGGAPGED